MRNCLHTKGIFIGEDDYDDYDDYVELVAKMTVALKVLEQSISSLYKNGEGAPLEEALEAYRSRLQEKEAILVNEQQVYQG